MRLPHESSEGSAVPPGRPRSCLLNLAVGVAILALAAAFIEPKPKDAATACPVEPEPELALEEAA